MASEVDVLAKEILGSLQDVVGSSWDQVSTYSRNQFKGIAKQSAKIGISRATGSLKDDDDGFKYELQSLKDQVEAVALVVANLLVIGIEKAVNAVVGAIWKALRGFFDAQGLGGLLPEKPPAI